jgi:hypothetical protein
MARSFIQLILDGIRWDYFDISINYFGSIRAGTDAMPWMCLKHELEEITNF